jgi:WD40 repeat protein
LCLCKSCYPHIFSGGVDGRAHVWDLTSMESPRLSFPAHNGRLNAMIYNSQSGLLYTAGNDGHVKCWNMASLDSGHYEFVNEYCTGHEDSRITCLTNLAVSGPSSDYIVCGNQRGKYSCWDHKARDD